MKMRKLPWAKIKSSKEYKEIISKRKKLITPFFIAFYFEAEAPSLGVIASRKVGCATKRNKAKRLLRNSFSEAKILNKSVVLIARAAILNSEYSILLHHVKKLNRKNEELESSHRTASHGKPVDSVTSLHHPAVTYSYTT